MNEGQVIAIVGAESTGKTTLAEGLHAALNASGTRAVLVREALREFCEHEQRLPRPDEQRAIAMQQALRITQARRDSELVIADTTALMVAIYSQHLFADASLLGDALAEQARYRSTLLTALDLPWVADGIQRDGPHVRAPVDTLLRGAMDRAGIAYSVIGGLAGQRLANALRAVQAALQPTTAGDALRWRHLCAECGDPDCERHLLAR